MAMTDPIADMLTRIRNANHRKHPNVKMPSSKMKMAIVQILKEEGFIENFKEIKLENNKKDLSINLKYKNDIRVINGLKKISKPGLKVYVEAHKVPKVYNGLGTAIVSTSQGMLTDRDAREKKIGGEVIAFI